MIEAKRSRNFYPLSCTVKLFLVSHTPPSPFTFTYPLTARVVGAPQITSQPISPIFLCSLQLQACPFPLLSSHLFFCPPCLSAPYERTASRHILTTESSVLGSSSFSLSDNPMFPPDHVELCLRMDYTVV